MHVRSLKLAHFIRHEGETTLALPERGIVTVIGPNESGKSTLVEAVSFALWGKTLRGEDPFDADGYVDVETDLASTSRERVGKKTTLSFASADARAPDGDAVYATTTKAQEALEAIVGDWQTWFQTHVFSSADASRWTLATDGERKRFVEGLLRLDFDGPLERCRKEARANREVLDLLARQLERARATLVSEERRAEDARAVLAAQPDAEPEDLPVQLCDFPFEIAKLDGDLLLGESLLKSVRQKATEASNAARDAASALDRAFKKRDLLLSGKCPTCEQPIPLGLTMDLDAAVTAAKVEAGAATTSARASHEAADAELAEVQAEQESLRGRRAALVEQAKSEKAERARRAEAAKRREQDAALRAKAEGIVREAQAAAEKARSEMEDVARSVVERKVEIALLSACEDVLGLRGVRAQVVSRVLAGLERATNVFLGAIAREGVAIRLRPYTEKKGGGVADSIALEWRDGERWRPYKAASGGARRRIDVSLLLALSEVAAAASGATVGTLWCDEVFDALDADGIERMSDVLSSLATDRCVVVISHSGALVKLLPAALRLRADSGRIFVDGARPAE